MSSYLEKAKASGAMQKAERQVKKDVADAAHAASWRDNMRPLRDRLADLLSSIPDDVKANGVALSSLQVQLRGRTAPKVHPGDLGTALRSLGYRRIRLWRQTDSAGFNAVWRTK